MTILENIQKTQNKNKEFNQIDRNLNSKNFSNGKDELRADSDDLDEYFINAQNSKCN